MTPNPRSFPRESALRAIDTTYQRGQERWEWKTSRFKGERMTRLECLITKGIHHELHTILNHITFTEHTMKTLDLVNTLKTLENNPKRTANGNSRLR